MTDTSLDDLGPVDYLVVEFPAGASNFTGEMAAELLALVDSGTIRVIDMPGSGDPCTRPRPRNSPEAKSAGLRMKLHHPNG
jgi:hypothetical protein